jgi:CRISPR system Cascade subunit CasB
MSYTDPFITYLEENREDRAMLAALRRGLGQPAGAAPEVSRYVQRRLAQDAPRYLEEAYYLIAPLFGLHSSAGGQGDMGNHFAALCEPGEDPPSNVERRFVGLLAAHSDDLPDALRQAISLLKAKDIPVNWGSLLDDILDWSHPDDTRRTNVHKRWSRNFWRKQTKSSDAAQTEPAA